MTDNLSDYEYDEVCRELFEKAKKRIQTTDNLDEEESSEEELVESYVEEEVEVVEISDKRK